MILYIILAAALIVSITVNILMYNRTGNTLDRLDHMLNKAVDGSFEESRFSEEKLSRIESKTKQYIAKGEKQRAQLEAERENIKSIIGDISHQTKTPIANIKLYSQLLSENTNLDKDATEIISQIESQTDNLSFLVSSLVKTSRLETGIITLHPTDNSVNEFIEQSREHLQRSLPSYWRTSRRETLTARPHWMLWDY